MLLRNESGEQKVKIIDFGIAKALIADAKQGTTSNGMLVGTPGYMSPEQCAGKELDGRSDLYSIACVMYESLTGELPYAGATNLEIMQKHALAPVPTVSELSRRIDIRKELASVVLWGLNKEPCSRPQNASEFAKKLLAVLETITLDKVPKLKKNNTQNPRMMSSIISAAILFVGISVFGLSYRSIFPIRPSRVLKNTIGSSALSC